MVGPLVGTGPLGAGRTNRLSRNSAGVGMAQIVAAASIQAFAQAAAGSPWTRNPAQIGRASRQSAAMSRNASPPARA